LRLFSFGGSGLALATLALVVFGAIECPPKNRTNEVASFEKAIHCHPYTLQLIDF